ncbi:MAG: hypothetical protein KKA64_00960 [Nanoarchaeota archaeon]|nr:hypothetical protein [Nanoarchaeota archaeon]
MKNLELTLKEQDIAHMPVLAQVNGLVGAGASQISNLFEHSTRGELFYSILWATIPLIIGFGLAKSIFQPYYEKMKSSFSKGEQNQKLKIECYHYNPQNETLDEFVKRYSSKYL